MRIKKNTIKEGRKSETKSMLQKVKKKRKKKTNE
jgi:hypothetical protein